MRRLLPACLSLLLFGGYVAGQDRAVSNRWHRILPGIGITISILVPTSDPSWETTASTIELSGQATATSGLQSVTWECSTCSPTSGSASGTEDWTIIGGTSSSTTVFEDNFNTVSNIDLALHAPTPTGISWAEVIDTEADNYIGVWLTSNASRAADDANSHGLLYLATPSTALSGTSYDIAFDLLTQTAGDYDAPVALIFGYADTSNYCGLNVYVTGSPNPLVLWKKVAGTPEAIATSTVAPSLDNEIRVEVRGTSLVVKVAGVTRITTTDDFCDDALGVGLGFGAVYATDDDVQNGVSVDNFTVVDQGAGSSGITLADGDNPIIVTACDPANCLSDTITVKKVASDTTDPVVTILQPTTAATYTAPAAAITLSGTATDAVGVTAVTWECTTTTCSPDSGSATLSGTATNRGWTFSTTLAVSLTNTIVVTATDAAANEGPKTLTAAWTPPASDTTPPEIIITTNSGNPFTSTTTPRTVGGTATDNVGFATPAVTCSNDLGAPGWLAATGTGSWNISVGLVVGVNTITCRATDLSGNIDEASIAITYNAPTLIITSNAELTQGTAGSSYYPLQLTSSGGIAPITWTNNGAGTTLNDADAQCAGLVVSSAGVVSGKPTTTGTCSWTSRATDSTTPTPQFDTQLHTIAIVAAGSATAHTYFDQLCGRSDLYTASWTTDSRLKPGRPRCISMRPDPTQTNINHPRWKDQLVPNGEYLTTTLGYDASSGPDITYSSAMGAARITIPVWERVAGLPSGIDATQTTIPYPANGEAHICRALKDFKIDNEVMTAVGGTCNTVAKTVQVVRGTWGTTKAAHSANTDFLHSVNSARNQLRLPIYSRNTSNHTYLITWDSYYATGWQDVTTNEPSKNFQISSGGDPNPGSIWHEPKISQFSGVSEPAGYDRKIHAGGVQVRTYQDRCGPVDYASGTYNTLGPNAGGVAAELLIPATSSCTMGAHNQFAPLMNRWMRWWIKIDVRVNDYDLWTMWVADEVQAPVQLFAGLQTRLMEYNSKGEPAPLPNMIQMWWAEFNSSLNQLVRPQQTVMIAYIRNFVVLEDPPDISSLVTVKPLGGS